MAKFFDGEYDCPIHGKFKWHGFRLLNGEIGVGREFVNINVTNIYECQDGSFDIELSCPVCARRFTVNEK